MHNVPNRTNDAISSSSAVKGYVSNIFSSALFHFEQVSNPDMNHHITIVHYKVNQGQRVCLLKGVKQVAQTNII